MYKKLLKSTTALALVASVGAGLTPQSTYANGEDTRFNLTIMHTNDTHSYVENFPALATAVEKIRTEKTNSLLLDAGDVFSGDLYFNEFQGQASLELMNELGYDAMVFGNHEFDLGSSEFGHQALVDFVSNAKFPMLGANVDFSKDPLFDGLQTKEVVEGATDGHIYNGIVQEIDGEKVGIFGLTTEETATISSANDITFSDYIEAAELAVADFEEMGVNKIIALTHLGFNDSADFDNDQLLGKAVPEIDIIVGGHTHVQLPKAVNVGTTEQPTYIVQAGQYTEVLGQLDVTFNEEGHIVGDVETTLHAVKGGEVSESAEEVYGGILAPFKEGVEELKITETGAVTNVVLDGKREDVRVRETNLGNIIADGMLAAAQKIDSEVAFAVQNSGGIRDSIEVGPITYGEVLKVLPFGNSLAIMELTGEEIYEALEHGAKEYPNPSGGFLQVSGLLYTIDQTAPVGNKIVEAYVLVGDEYIEIDPSESYKVATNVFTAKGGDDFEVFANAYAEGRVSEPGNIDYLTFIDQLVKISPVNAEVEGRILNVAPFRDVTLDKWFFPFVQDMYFKGLTQGTSPTTYSPNRYLTRAQAVSFIIRAIEAEPTKSSTFSDISKLAEQTQLEIAAAQELGIVNGKDGKFLPNAYVTRAQFALMIQRTYNAIYEEEYVVEEEADYADLGNYADETKNAIYMITELGLASGDNGNFNPGRSTTRAHAAKIISNFTDYFYEDVE